MFREEDSIRVELTYSPLSITANTNFVKSPKAGAVVMFAGCTTRDSFNDLPVKSLTYQSYPPLALRTLFSIASEVKAKHDLTAISIIHRLGTVPIGEESILILASSSHRHPAFAGASEALELTKEKAEVWKLEEFAGEGMEGVWRANRDGVMGVKMEKGDGEEAVSQANTGGGGEDVRGRAEGAKAAEKAADGEGADVSVGD
ncbi:hypothetical protein W97_06781 [Coniosporium apollinis CBS 100218]|uniref:MOCS2B n=1 Tax=Coniosporium apollinis (strain CBS 100218) TaxID=1168221 RepID=R7Z0P1_CONA1|nr:uncharacterized protein W97_06781 [Coniosporium apollinis CBS 100218]EON67638.1 hypothetical protein W97_06781 [Coniosporium apollinis CBS 100218]